MINRWYVSNHGWSFFCFSATRSFVRPTNRITFLVSLCNWGCVSSYLHSEVTLAMRGKIAVTIAFFETRRRDREGLVRPSAVEEERQEFHCYKQIHRTWHFTITAFSFGLVLPLPPSPSLFLFRSLSPSGCRSESVLQREKCEFDWMVACSTGLSSVLTSLLRYSWLTYGLVKWHIAYLD